VSEHADCAAPLLAPPTELRIGDDADELGAEALRARWLTNAAPEPRRVRCFGQPWLMPASSSCMLADLHKWSGALRGMRPACGFELVVLDPPWPSRSVRRSGAYETADVLELLPAHVQLLPLLNV
jgi:hypothetical protein